MRSWRNSIFLSGEISTAKRHILPERMALLLLLIFLGASFAFPMEQAEFPVMAREQMDGVSGAGLPDSKGPGQLSGAGAAIAGCPNIESKGCMSWHSGGRVTVILDPKINNQGPSFVAAVKQAFLIWAANSGSQGVFFTFSIQSPPADLENQLSRGALPDQTYYVVVDVSSPPRDGYPALTATRPCPATIGRYPMGAITFLRPINGAFGAGPGTLREIVTHEIGHTFGLKDCLPSVCPQGTSVMSLPLAGDALLGPTACDKIVIDSMTGFSAWPTPSCTMTASRMTYRICLKGTSDCITDTSVWEAEPQKIGNRTVMRGYWLGDQLRLKTYGACDAQLGQIEVGSEWADLGNPNNRGLFLYDPPKQLVPYGVSAGTSLIWQSNQGDECETTRILAYEDVTVPARTFQQAMKYEWRSYSNGSLSDGPVTFWLDPQAGLVRGDDGEAVLELASFTGQPAAPALADTVDLALTASHSGTFSVGQAGVLTLAVNNIGRKATSSPLVLTDILPEGTSYQSASGTGWECQADGRVVTCSYSGSLAPGAATTVNLDVRVTATPSTMDPGLGAEHLASIQTNGEADFLNNGIVDFIVLPPATNHQVFLTLPGGGAVPTSTMGSAGELVAGYAVGTLTTGTAPYGTAVFSYTQNGIVVSEVGVPASPPTLAARFFVDTRTGVRTGSSNATINILTGFAAVNMGSTGATLSLRLRGESGNLLTQGTIRLARGEHVAKFLDQLEPDFILPAGFINNGMGTLEITSDQPVSVLALRLTTNQRGELLMTSTPVADLSQPAPAWVLSFPQIADGGGYRTTLTLMNTSNATESGVIEFFDDTGSPLLVGTTNGGPATSQFPYSILAGGFLRLETDGLPPEAKVGWARLTPAAGTTAPVSAAMFGFTPGNVLVTESGVPAVTATTHARIYVDKSGGHDTGLAVANPGSSNMRITATAFQPDGVTPAGNAPGTIDLSPMGHVARFAGQLIGQLPEGFTGVLDLSSTAPFVALTLRSLMNARGDFLVTTFPIADANQPAPTPLVFPQIADGSGYQSQIILLSIGGPAATITVNYLGNDGNPVAIGRISGNAVQVGPGQK